MDLSIEGNRHMLLTFRSKAAADVIMLSHHAAPLLRAAGKSIPDQVPERGVFTADQLPAAIAGIEHAIQAAPDEPDKEDDTPTHPLSESVSLQRRAYPLLDMLRKAQARGSDVVWEVGSAW